MKKDLETLETFRDEEDGNSISSSSSQGTQLMSWFFTWNNYTEDHVEMLETYLPKICKWAVVEREIGESGTPHLQGVIGLKKRMRWSEFDLPTKVCHPSWYKTRNVKQAQKYCRKDGNIVIDFGCGKKESKYVENIEELFQWEIDICEILKTVPDKRTIHWFWEPTGCTGKTTFQKYVFTHYDDCVVLSGKAADMKNGIVDFQTKNKRLPKIVLINIPMTQELGYVSYTGIEEVKDMFFYSGKYEGGMVCGPNPHVIVFANEAPETYKMAKDRWLIKRI